MESVKRYNGLTGSVKSREEIQEHIDIAIRDEQPHIAEKLGTLLQKFDDTKFHFESVEKQPQLAPESILQGIEFENIVSALFGLGKPVSSDEIYSLITNLMLNTIKEVGHLPWQKEWIGSGIFGAMNYVTKKPYTGINFLTLNFTVKRNKDGRGYLVFDPGESPFYLTFNQIKKAGATLKKGSKGREVIYYNFILNYNDGKFRFSGSDANKFAAFVKKNGITPEQVNTYLKRFPILKYYMVFRASDCENLTIPEIKKKSVEPIAAAQGIIDDFPGHPKYISGDQKAYYVPATDSVHMPLIEAFSSEAAYYSTYFHEIVHSTGHPKRLNRDMSGRFGNQSYAFEELIAELGAVFLSANAGILFQTRDNSAKYLKSWNKKLVGEMENDNKFFLKAAASAQKAANHILGIDHEKEIIPKPAKETSRNKKPVSKPAVQAEKTVAKVKPVAKVKAAIEKPIRHERPKPTRQRNDPGKQLALFGVKKRNGLGAPLTQVQPEMTVGDLKPELQAKPGSIAERRKLRQTVEREYFKIDDPELAAFLGNIERKPKESVVITIAGEQGSGKSRFGFKFMNALAQNQKTGHGSIEEHPESSLYEKKVDEYLNAKAQATIENPEIRTISDLQRLIERNDVVVLDSFQKLREMERTFEVDKDLRKKYDGKLFLVIFQLTTDGKMKGGSNSQFDGDIILFFDKSDDYKESFVKTDKNRYNDIPARELKYSVYTGEMIREEKKQMESESADSNPIKFSFDVKKVN